MPTDLIVPEPLHLLLIGCLSHLEDQRGLTKPEIFSRDVTIQEDVDPWNQRSVIKLLAYSPSLEALGSTFSDAEGHGDHAVGTGDSVQTADEVRQVVQHTQVVLNHNDVPGSQWPWVGTAVCRLLTPAVVTLNTGRCLYLSGVMSERMVMAAFSLCFTSR